MNKLCKIVIMLMSLGFILSMTTGCSSTVVPPGTVVIVESADGESTLHTNGAYMVYGRDRAYFVDTKLNAFTESMQILCKDKVNMTVDVKWIGSFDISKDKLKIIKEKVPSVRIDTGDIKGFQLSLNKFYATAMKDIIRGNTRAIVAPYITDNVPEQRQEIQDAIRKSVVDRFVKLGYPVKTSDILVSNLDFDDSVTETRKAIKNAQLDDEKKAALAKAAVAQASRNEDIERARGRALLEKKRAEAAANKIWGSSLTPNILKMKELEVAELHADNMKLFAEKFGQGKGDMIVLPYEALSTAVNTTMNRSNINQLR